MTNQRKFNIKSIKMNQDMRVHVLDQVRRTIQQNLPDVESTEFLKEKLEAKYQGHWNVIIGNGMQAYFNEKTVKQFIELQTQSKSIIMFRKILEIKNK